MCAHFILGIDINSHGLYKLREAIEAETFIASIINLLNEF